METDVEVAPNERPGKAALDARGAAFVRLTEANLTTSYRLAAVILGNASEAEDAVHDAAVLAWRRFPSLRDTSRFTAGFQRILVNVCRDRLRARRSGQARPLDEAVEPEAPVDRVGFPEREALRAALNALSPEHRTVVVLRYFSDLPLEAIAKRTGERLGTVKSRLHYALMALRASHEVAEREPGRSDR